MKAPTRTALVAIVLAALTLSGSKALDAQAHPLNDHDVIELAGVKMEFFLKTA